MDDRVFGREMARAKSMLAADDNQDYWIGYQRRLRRAYHGESFGTEREHHQWLELVDDGDVQRQSRGRGYRDGLMADGE